MPQSYIPPLGIGDAATIAIPRDAYFSMEWDPPPNDFEVTDDGNYAPSRRTHYNDTLFADPSLEFPPQFMCFPEVEGHQAIPETVIAELPESGLIFHVNTTHVIEVVEAAGEKRRFDLVGEFVNVSRYAKQ